MNFEKLRRITLSASLAAGMLAVAACETPRDETSIVITCAADKVAPVLDDLTDDTRYPTVQRALMECGAEDIIYETPGIDFDRMIYDTMQLAQAGDNGF